MVAPGHRLLLVFLDDLRRPDLRLVGVFAELALGPALSKQVPALIQLDLHLREPALIVGRKSAVRPQAMLFIDQLFDVLHYGRIAFLVRHGDLVGLRVSTRVRIAAIPV